MRNLLKLQHRRRPAIERRRKEYPKGSRMLWLKAFHIVFVVTWFAGIFYLPRLFLYHAAATDAVSIERFQTMEKRLFGIMTIGATLTLLFGVSILSVVARAAAGRLAARQADAGPGPDRVPRMVLSLDARFAQWTQTLVDVVPRVQRGAVGAADRDRGASGRKAVLSGGLAAIGRPSVASCDWRCCAGFSPAQTIPAAPADRSETRGAPAHPALAHRPRV